jgi:hypothetical protein
MRTTCLWIVDEMQSREVELRRFVLKDEKTSCDSPFKDEKNLPVDRD